MTEATAALEGLSSRSFTRAARFCRKHAAALVCLGLFHFILFFPSLFMGRVISPNDVFYQYDPWRSMKGGVHSQNPLINDPPTGWLGLMSMLRDDPSSFHWNRYVGSGIPGFGSVASATLSPFIALPALVLPLWAVWNGIVLAKLNFAFYFAYWWLREERLGKRGAAVGAMVLSAAGVYSVWWLWQGTNATALYPALLLLIARGFRRGRSSMAASTLLALGFLVSGFPATVAYGFYLAAVYAVAKALRHRRLPWRAAGAWVGGAAIALAIAAPLIAPLVQFLDRSGYLEMRRGAAEFNYPLDHIGALVHPHWLGSSAGRDWHGDPRLGASNNFIEATVYAGVVSFLCALAGLAARRRGRLLWLLLLGFLLLVMFLDTPLTSAAGQLPGLRLSPLTRLRVLLPIPIGWLAAAGIATVTRRLRAPFRSRLAVAVAALVAIDLGLFAGKFYPYLTPAEATIGSTPSMDFMRSEQGAFRIAPLFDFLWPNTAELMRVEDIRSHFGSEQRYRDILHRIDPSSWSGRSTVLVFNELSMRLDDPWLAFLGSRYIIEQPTIGIYEWKLAETTHPGIAVAGQVTLRSGTALERTVTIGEEKFHAVRLTVRPTSERTSVVASVTRPETGKVLVARTFTGEELTALPGVFLPVSPFAREGEALVINLAVESGSAEVAVGLDRLPAFQRMSFPLVPRVYLPDARVLENVEARPRHFAMWKTRVMPFAGMLAPGADPNREALVESAPPSAVVALAAVPLDDRRVKFRPLRYGPSLQEIETTSTVPFLFCTSEKVTPELRLCVDGVEKEPLTINGLFAATPLTPGKHVVTLERRIGRGFWLPSAIGALILIGVVVVELGRKWLNIPMFRGGGS